LLLIYSVWNNTVTSLFHVERSYNSQLTSAVREGFHSQLTSAVREGFHSQLTSAVREVFNGGEKSSPLFFMEA